MNQILIFADSLIVASEFVKKSLVEYGVLSDRIKVIGLGFSSDDLRFNRVIASTSNSGPIRLISIATIEPRKGYDSLLDFLKAGVPALDAPNFFLVPCLILKQVLQQLNQCKYSV